MRNIGFIFVVFVVCKLQKCNSCVGDYWFFDGLFYKEVV